MKLLHFSDLHLDTPFRWAGPELARARRHALRDTLRRIVTLARDENVDALLSAGDLYEHERFSPDTAQFLRDEFATLDNIPVYLAPGNHDWWGPASLYRQVEWTPNVHVFSEDRLTPVTLTDGIQLWGAAHRAPANTDGFLEHFVADRAGVNLALFHGSETAALHFQESGKAPHAPFSAEQVEAANINHAFVGHFHTPRDATRHTYPGNPDPLTFGETGNRGVVIHTVHDDGTVTRDRRRVAVSEVHDIDVDVTGASQSSEIRDRVVAAVADLRGIVRVSVAGEVGPDVDVHLGDLAVVAPHLEALVPRLGKVSVGYDFLNLAEEGTVRGQFVRDVQAASPLNDDARRRVLITGLRALEGRAAELEVH
jgi:DNA repair protein SbcD/Mre11